MHTCAHSKQQCDETQHQQQWPHGQQITAN